MPIILERAIVGEPSPQGLQEEVRALNIAFIRLRLEACLSAAGAAVTEAAECLRHGLDQAAGNAETWEPGHLEPLEDLVTNLADALENAILAQGLIDPHHRIHSAIERYQHGED